MPDPLPREDDPGHGTSEGTALGQVPRAAVATARPLGRHGLLWLALLVLSVLVILDDDVPIAAPNPALAVAAATLAGFAGLALLYLGARRFSLSGRPLDLFIGGGFGVLAVANIAVRVALPAVRAATGGDDTGGVVLLSLRAVAAILFCLPLLGAQVAVPPKDRRRYARRIGALVGIPIALGVGTVAAMPGRLPDALGPRGRALLDAQATIIDALPDQAPWLLAANGAIGVLMLLVTLGYAARARGDGDPALAPLVAPFTLFTFGQFHTLLFPPLAPDYISTALGLRLCAYLLLLATLVAQAGRDLEARAAADERLRLSRELHDGLMQQLYLLNLRLHRARAPGREATERVRDLDAAARVLEAALIEARQAIVALRTGVVAWDEFVRAVEAFAEEFAANHEVAVEVRAGESGRPVEAGLQAEVLRLLHEACANAVRHGGAGQIEIAVKAEVGWLHVSARDDGRGFDPDMVGEGVGLRSLAERAATRGGRCGIDSAPGEGATVWAHLPLARHGRETP